MPRQHRDDAPSLLQLLFPLLLSYTSALFELSSFVVWGTNCPFLEILCMRLVRRTRGRPPSCCPLSPPFIYQHCCIYPPSSKSTTHLHCWYLSMQHSTVPGSLSTATTIEEGAPSNTEGEQVDVEGVQNRLRKIKQEISEISRGLGLPREVIIKIRCFIKKLVAGSR